MERMSESINQSKIVQPGECWISIDMAENGLPTEQKLTEPLGESIKNKRNLTLVRLLWESFARSTTGHGFARMVDRSEPCQLRVFWGLVVILLAAGLFTSIFVISYETLVLKELRREFIAHQNQSLHLPDIHICDTSLFNSTVLEEMGLNSTLASYLALSLSPFLASHGFRENMLRRKQIEREYRNVMKNRTIDEVFVKATLKCEDIILGCTHKTIRYTSKHCCHKFFGSRRYVTDLAILCVSTHNQPPLEELFVSQIYGFTVYLKTNTRNRFEFDSTIISSNVAPRRGIIYAVSDRITTVTPAISTAGHYAVPGTWTGVSISLTRTDNLELQAGILSPYSCAPTHSKDHLHLVPNYEAYSERNCVFASAVSALQEKLNCTRFRFHTIGKLTPCDPNVMIDAYSSELAESIKRKTDNCPKDCILDEYNVISSSTQLELGDHGDMHADEKHDDRMVHSAIHFFYPSFSYTIIKNHPPSLFRWLSEVGGNMSLFLGASLVTLLEFAVLMMRFVRYCFIL